ncbi:MAG: slipin family protein [Anaerolineae bacterium]|nr:slipin family protein [Anaerolineae bacterium]
MGEIIEFLVSGIGVIIVFLILLVAAAVKVVQEYERGVIFRLGRLAGVKGPGIFFIIPFVDRMVKVDLRVVTLDIPAQEAITRDNVTVRVNAVAYFRVIDPADAIVQIEDFQRATWQIAQTSLRSVLGQSDLDELLIHRDQINQKLQQIIDEATEPWGIKVSIVEVKDVELPDSMKRAMARQAEAEREKRAKIIHASGEFDAAQQLQDAASVIAQQPAALQLRYLQTLTEIAVEKNSTIIFPVPIEFLNAFSQWFERAKTQE